MISLFTQKITCPFCFHVFSPDAIRFRCINPACPKLEPDPFFAKARGYGTTVMGRVLVPGKNAFGHGLPREMRCNACTKTSYTRICPLCHYELPDDIGEIEQRIIAIVGGRATGKTHYIASLITRLKYVVGANFDLKLQTLGDETRERWERDFYNPLFVRKTVLQPNRPAAIDPLVKSPLTFRMFLGKGGNIRAFNLSIFDTAGEDLTSFATMSVHHRYINHADGIIFLLDPLQIPRVRQVLPQANLPPEDSKSSPENIVDNICIQFKRLSKLRPTQKAATPVAFTLSKVDTLLPLLDPGSPMQNPVEHHAYLDLDDIQSVNSEISNYVEAWIGSNFTGTIDNNFARYEYFGVSSLGGQPDPQNRLTTVSPLRVEDPFLWILYKLGLIRGRKGR